MSRAKGASISKPTQAQSFLESLSRTQQKISVASSPGGYVMPISFSSSNEEDRVAYRRRIQEEQKEQIEAKKRKLEALNLNELEADRSLLKADQDKAELERQQRQEKLSLNTKTLREFYLKQQEDKQNAKTI